MRFGIKKIGSIFLCAGAACFLVLFLVWLFVFGPLGFAGRWEDDSKNFSRAFQNNIRPSNLVIVHSRYMRTPHFTYEYEYFFEVRPNKKLLDDFIASGQMKKFDASTDLNIQLDDHFETKPAWFEPKPIDNYDVWIFKDEPRQNFRLFIDKETGELYYTDFST